MWEDFEINCTSFLNNNFNRYATFTHQGGANSTKPDILVKTKTGNTFYIEVKQKIAQCGQFVLFPNNVSKTFEYSIINKTPINAYTQKIIEYMNSNFDKFKNPTAKGESILIENSQHIFASWIIEFYKQKNVKFIITDNNIILPLQNLANYFNITAKYRIKKSGSSNVPQKSVNSILNYLESNKYNISSSKFLNKKLIISSNDNLNKLSFNIDNIQYMFSQKKASIEYTIKKLSNTKNANVIFSITLAKNVIGISHNEFISSLL